MPKKFTISLALALGCANFIGGTLPASALVEKDDVKYWSVSEIMDFKAQMQNKVIETCGEEGGECARRVYLSYYTNQTDQYMAYIAADNELNNFTITAINPAAETIKIFITDYERDWMSDSLRTVPLTSVYAAWGEPSMRDVLMGTVSGAGAFYASEIESNTLRDGIYRLFGASRSGSANVFNIDEIPTMREVEFAVPGSNLVNNSKGDFYFTTLRDSGGDVYGYRSYDTCLTSSDYEVGKECRMMFSSNGGYVYMPFSVDTDTSADTTSEVPAPSESEDNVSEPSDSTSEPEASSDAVSDVTGATDNVVQIANISTSTSRVPVNSGYSVMTTSDSSDNSTSTAEKSEDCNCNTTATQSENNVDLPTTGFIDAGESAKEESAFPWWIIAFVFSGIAITIWWFIPTKKFEKGVDK